MEQGENENSLGGGSPMQKPSAMTLEQAISMGEYNPEYLGTFPEWHQLSKHTQFQYIRMATDNRRKQLLMQWAEVNNMLDFRLKPELHDTLKNIEAQMKKLVKDREKLYVEYSKVL
jgi:hypothetical protein